MVIDVQVRTAPRPAPLEALALSWLENDEAPRVLVDLHLRLLWSNAAAAPYLRAGGQLEEQGGAFASGNRALHQELAALVAGCREGTMSLCLPCPTGGHLLFRASAVGEGEEGRFVGITFRHSRLGPAPRFADLKAAFHLTGREQLVLDHMIEGSTAEEIARRLSLSIETVRSHIRSIYGKTNASSRERLFARLRAYQI